MEKKLNKNLIYIIGLSTTLLIIVITAYYGVYSQNKLKEKPFISSDELTKYIIRQIH